MSSDRITIELRGFKEMEQAFAQLGRTLTITKQRQAMAPGAQIIKKAIKDRAPIGTVEHHYYGSTNKSEKRKGRGKGVKLETFRPGSLKKSVGIRWVRGKALLFIGPGKAYKRKYSVWYGDMVEYGTANMPAQPFVRPGFEASQKQAEEAMARKAEEIIYKETKRLLG